MVTLLKNKMCCSQLCLLQNRPFFLRDQCERRGEVLWYEYRLSWGVAVGEPFGFDHHL